MEIDIPPMFTAMRGRGKEWGGCFAVLGGRGPRARLPAMAARKKAPEPTFEERLEALERVVHDLEGEELSLEASIERYREGVTHLKACRSLLDDAEQRLVELVQEDGETVEQPLKVTDRGLERDAPRES